MRKSVTWCGYFMHFSEKGINYGRLCRASHAVVHKPETYSVCVYIAQSDAAQVAAVCITNFYKASQSSSVTDM